MTSAILAILAGIAASVSGYFAYRNSPLKSRREAERDVAREDAEFSREKSAIREAVHGHDTTKVNSIIGDLVKTVALCAILPALLSSNLACASKPVYVSGSTFVEPCTNSHGVACWAVPDQLMGDILIRLKRLQMLESSNRVDMRLR